MSPAGATQTQSNLSSTNGWRRSRRSRTLVCSLKRHPQITKYSMSCAFLTDICLGREPTRSCSVYGKKERLLSIWPYMSTLPVLSHWEWSPLVRDAFTTNHGVIYPPSVQSPEAQDSREVRIMPGLLVIHLRRGDFAGHCRYLAKATSQWNAFNSFPELPDKYDDQVHADTLLSDYEAAMAHCYPSIAQIVDKVKTVREDSREALEYLYIMSNGADSWVTELILALHDLGGWKHIGSNRDLRLTWEQTFVAQALDMLVAQKAHVFIGNGVSRPPQSGFLLLTGRCRHQWSSLSSNIVMLRTVNGLPPESNRFW